MTKQHMIIPAIFLSFFNIHSSFRQNFFTFTLTEQLQGNGNLEAIGQNLAQLVFLALTYFKHRGKIILLGRQAFHTCVLWVQSFESSVNNQIISKFYSQPTVASIYTLKILKSKALIVTVCLEWIILCRYTN